MPKSADAQSDFLNWLSSDQCVPWLQQQARLVLLRAHELHLPFELWPYGDPSGMPAEELQQNSAEIAHEFWLFIYGLLRKRGSSMPPEVLPSPERGLHVTGAYLRNSYLNHLRGRVRRKDLSTRRHLYRRLRETLGKAPEFYYRAQKDRAYYSMKESAPLVSRPIAPDHLTYADWTSPCTLVSLQQMMQFKREHLCALAALFWREACTRLQGAYYLPIWELTAYLCDHFGFFQEAERLTPEVCERTASGSQPKIPPETGGLALLAEQLVSSWSPMRRKVFCLAVDNDDMTYKRIAGQAGLSSASHAKYHLDRACKELAAFCETWPGLTPPSAEREFWTQFLIITAEVCKKSLCERPNNMKGYSSQPKDGP